MKSATGTLRLSDVKHEKSDTMFFSNYASSYNQDQIHEINYQLANKVYDFIAAKLAEADQPPAQNQARPSRRAFLLAFAVTLRLSN